MVLILEQKLLSEARLILKNVGTQIEKTATHTGCEYLRTHKIRALTLLDYVMHLLTNFLCSLGLRFPSQQANHCLSGKLRQKVHRIKKWFGLEGTLKTI